MTLAVTRQEAARKGLNLLQMTIHQYRKLYLFSGAYLGALMLGSIFVEQPVSPLLTEILCLPFAVVMLQTLVAFVNPDADLAAPGSHYPSYLLRLPVKTHALALWPMLAGGLWAFLTWVTFAGVFLLRREVHVEVLAPALGFMALVLSMQALMWTPFRFGNLRLILMLLIPLTLVSGGTWLAGFGWSMTNLCFAYAASSLVAGAFAWRAVVQARTTPLTGRSLKFSEKPAFPILRSIPQRAAKNLQPFKSALAAQTWMEWRLQGRILPMVTGAVLAFVSIPLLLDGALLTPLGDRGMIRPWLYSMLGVMPFVPVVLATCVGMGARKPNMRGGDGAYHLFYATRPLPSSQVIRAKVLAFTIGTAVAWALNIAVCLAWLLLPAVDAYGGATNGLIVLTSGMDGLQWAVAGLTLCALIGLTWRNQLVGAFVDYVPSRWMATGYPMWVTVIGGLIFAMADARQFTTNGGFAPHFIVYLGCLLAVKVCVSAWAGRGIVRRRPEEAAYVLRSAASWLVGGSVVGLLLSWFISLSVGGVLNASFGFYWEAYVFGLIITPLFRPLLARFALEVGRHR